MKTRPKLASLWIAGCVVAVMSGCIAEPQPELDPTAALDRTAWRAAMRKAKAQTGKDDLEPYWPYRQGELYVERDSLVLAETALEMALERDPAYAPAAVLLSRVLYETGRYAEAVAVLETARDQWPVESPTPMPAQVLGALALNLEAMGNLADAETATGELEQTGRVREELRSVLSFLVLRSDRFLDAAVPARRAVEANGKNAVNQNNYGITLVQGGRPADARRAFLAAVELDPDLPGPLYNLAILEKFYFLNDGQAKTWFERYSELAHEDPDNLRTVIYENTDSGGGGTQP